MKPTSNLTMVHLLGLLTSATTYEQKSETTRLTNSKFILFSVFPTASKSIASYYLFSRNAFNTTIIELNDIPIAAIQGATQPIAAMGMAIIL